MKAMNCPLAVGLSIGAVALLSGCGGHHTASDDSNEPPIVESAAIVQNRVSCTTAMVPTRDGTKIYTEIYRPANMAAGAKLPVVISRSPYGKLLSASCFAANNSMASYTPDYIGIFQEVRGTAQSEGTFTPFLQEQNDGYDVIEWAARQSWSNGKVGMIGGSYGAVTLWQPALTAPPHLVAIAPAITSANYRDDWVGRNGVFDLAFARNWGQTSFMADQIERTMKAKGATPDQITAAITDYNTRLAANAGWFSALPLSGNWDTQTQTLLPYLADWLKHPNYDDYWAKVDVAANIDKVRVPAIINGGWYDLFTIGTIDSYIAMRTRAGTQEARDGTMLLMDCCGHGFYRAKLPGEITWVGDADTSNDKQRRMFLDNKILGTNNGIAFKPRVQLSILVPPDTGTVGSAFKFNASDFPIPGTTYKAFSLRSSGNANTRIGDGVLDGNSPSSGTADTFSYDPLNPVPTIGGRDSNAAFDQSGVEDRKDVLVYTGAVLTESIAMIGKVSFSFWAQTDGTDTDFTAKLVDVHPDGIAHNIVDRIVRARFRNGGKTQELLSPNTPYQFALDLGYVATMLKPGHKLRLEVSSSNFPQYARNLNTGASNEDTSTTRIARNTILHDATHPSTLSIPVVGGVAAP